MPGTVDRLEALRRRAARSLGQGDDALDLTAVLSTRDLVGPPPEQTAGLARQALEALAESRLPTDEEFHALEQAIRALRPFVLVERGRLEPLPPEATSIFGRWDAFRDAVAPVMRSVGKIVRNLPNNMTDDIATGFLIGPGLVLTNHHVVRVLAGGGDVLLPDVASIGFYQEYSAEEAGWVTIHAVEAIHPELDAAVLRIGDGGFPGPPIALPTDPVDLEDGDAIAAIGFPLSDPKRPLSIAMLDGKGRGKKRGSPGEVVDAAGSDTIDHDCSTMPGSSGSPIFSMAGDLVGLHADGTYGTRNGAIRIDRLAEFVTEAIS